MKHPVLLVGLLYFWQFKILNFDRLMLPLNLLRLLQIESLKLNFLNFRALYLGLGSRIEILIHVLLIMSFLSFIRLVLLALNSTLEETRFIPRKICHRQYLNGIVPLPFCNNFRLKAFFKHRLAVYWFYVPRSHIFVVIDLFWNFNVIKPIIFF